MSTGTTQDLLVFNGINGATGGYLLPPLAVKDVAALARGEPLDPNHLIELKWWHEWTAQARFGPRSGIDPLKLEETGWALICAHNTAPAILEALRPLRQLRKSQAGKNKEHYYQEFTGERGYRPGESKQDFLARQGMGPGPADPERVPYYLLLVGDPETIPFRFQYQLDVQYAVGRIWFESVEEYARYAASVVAAETGKVALPRRAVFFGVANDDDPATHLSARELVEPLAQQAPARLRQGQPAWQVEAVLGGDATKARLGRILGGDQTPALLFTASHGMGFPKGDVRQLPHQGALLCQDWPGPAQWQQPIPPAHYFAADDVGAGARLLGLIAFHFACYGAGTPRLDDFAHQVFREPAAIAPNAFLARLPRRLLAHDAGGALAVVGHVERAWGYSFMWANAGRQVQVFEDALKILMEGGTVGYALEFFNQRYADLSSELSAELEQAKWGKSVNEYALAGMWTANNDARSYTIVGDPAVRLPLAAGEGTASRPALDTVVLATTNAPPASPAPTGTEAFAPEPLAIPIADTERRYREREPARQATAFAPGAPAVLRRNDPERVRRRVVRLGVAPAAVEAALATAPSFGVVPPADQDPSAALLLERILGKNDLVSACFLEAGARAARPVGRIRVRSASGQLLGFGTGSLVAPRLLLTNNHVLQDAAAAAASLVEFNVQDGLDGRPLAPEVFALAPQDFFLTHPTLDFTLVAVAPRSGAGSPLDGFGWNRAHADDDPILVEEYVNIVQHPGGQPKQLALRDNQVIDLLPDFLHYRADTEPGSSGSPVFNDQWELVGLHHSGVPRRDAQGCILARGGGLWRSSMGENRIDWIANEGVRLSRILAHVRAQSLSTTQAQLRDGLFDAALSPAPTETARPEAQAAAAVTTEGVTITLPLHITVRVGAPVAPAPVEAPAVAFAEAVSIDPNYATRKGYDSAFLGHGRLQVPLPRLTAAQQADAARVRTARPGDDPHELKYHHYSVVMNRRRRLAFFTAVNIDGSQHWAIQRETDKWFYDPRLGREEQVGEELYASNPFDRGHLVRRLDPAWGGSFALAKVANDDTFHFTNCSPQHERFNQGKDLWAGLEDYLLNKAAGTRKRLTVFTGPVFVADDPEYRGVRIPRQFWKVAVLARGTKLAALGFVVSQAELIRPVVEEAAPAVVARTYQVPVRHIEELTSLNFGTLRDVDVGSVASFAPETGAPRLRELNALEDIQLPDGAAPVAFGTATRSGAEPVPGTDLSYFLIAFDSEGNERTDGPAGRVSDLAEAVLTQEAVTDVFLFSHGWMGDVPSARAQYGEWIRTMAASSADVARARSARPGFLPLLLGIHWPSLPWGDEELAAAPSFAPGSDVAEVRIEAYARRLGDTPDVRRHLRTVFAAAAAGAAPEHLPPQVAEAYRALDRATGLANGGVGAAPGSDREGFDPEAVYQDARTEAGVSFALFGADTLLAPLRTLSFWKMKDRGRLIGEQAVHPLLVRLLRASAGREVRFHLAGHSFGCIVASAAVAGPAGAAPLPRPVESLTLLQGALSLWGFCSDIPSLAGQAGYFHSIVREGRVRGPIVTTRSRFDRAVGTWYPRGARLGGQVVFATGAAALPRYGGVGTFGIQGPGLDLEDTPMQPEDGAYSFAAGRVYNLEASTYIRTGGGFSGAHSDLNHPEVAHAVWSAALV